jgi:RHS repeat-associated protein
VQDDDAAGNMSTSDTGVTFQYDAEGRMISTNNGAYGTEINNALGQRVDHTWPGNRIIWLYHPDGSEMADFMPVPWNDWGNVYFNLHGRPVAKYIGGVESWAFFFHANHLGSTSMISDWSGSVRQKEIFYPYGQFWAWGGDVGSFRFASLREVFPFNEAEVFMSQTRDHHARLYRWLSPDPLAGDVTNPQSLNRYAYVMNNPMNMMDPSGLAGECGPGRSSCQVSTRHTNISYGANLGCPGCNMPSYIPGYSNWYQNADAYFAMRASAERLFEMQLHTARISGPGLYQLTSDGGVYRWIQGGTVQSTIGGVSSGGPAVTPGRWEITASLRDLWEWASTRSWTVHWIIPLKPIPGVLGVGPAGTFSYNPQTHNLCGGIGAGASAGRNAAMGPNVYPTSAAKVDKILKGWSTSVGYNIPLLPPSPGASISVNDAGALVNTNLGVPGFSIAETYSVCTQ